MKYNTKEVYFGCPTYNIGEGDLAYTSPQAFIKEEDGYKKINSKKDYKYNEYKSGTDEYVTISYLRSIEGMMSDTKDIPEQVSGMLVRLYLLKYKVQIEQERKQSSLYNKNSKTK